MAKRKEEGEAHPIQIDADFGARGTRDSDASRSELLVTQRTWATYTY